MDTSGSIRSINPNEEIKPNEVMLTEQEATELRKKSFKLRKNWMRNKSCSCNSGKKFKHCCWNKMARYSAVLLKEAKIK